MSGQEDALLVIRPRAEAAPRMEQALAGALAGRQYETVETAEALRPVTGRRVLFAVAIGADGVNLEYYRMLAWLRDHPGCLEGCLGAVIVDGQSELYTKTLSRELVLAANLCGCAFIGAPLVEATLTLHNFDIKAANLGTDPLHAYHAAARDLADRLMRFEFQRHGAPRLAVLHASSHKSSNTFALWHLIRESLPGWETDEIGLRNGAVADCGGCPYKMCLHFGEQGSCFYGGLMVEEVYPAVRAADAVVMICPNYNDALNANLTAFINRLTALYRTQSFHQKALFALVVSGYSGSDLLARQLIGALNMNKGFYLPPRFVMMETANKAGELMARPGIVDRAEAFAHSMEAALV